MAAPPSEDGAAMDDDPLSDCLLVAPIRALRFRYFLCRCAAARPRSLAGAVFLHDGPRPFRP
eukprot:6149414-Lingulodinium_polyedra.AAC.1